jgi:hypothetical protein
MVPAMSILASLVDLEKREDRAFLHGAFTVALDDFAEHRRAAPTLEDAAVVAATLAVMARLDADRVDPVRLADDEREETALMVVERCAAYAPLFARKAPSLSPWFDRLAGSRDQIDAVLDGKNATPLDGAWLAKLAPTVFRIPAPRRYLERFFTRVFAMLDGQADPSGTLWLCLRFRRWFRLSNDQLAILDRHVARWRGTPRHPVMCAALRKLATAA